VYATKNTYHHNSVNEGGCDANTQYSLRTELNFSIIYRTSDKATYMRDDINGKLEIVFCLLDGKIVREFRMNSLLL
jgi:hypothetical protein